MSKSSDSQEVQFWMKWITIALIMLVIVCWIALGIIVVPQWHQMIDLLANDIQSTKGQVIEELKSNLQEILINTGVQVAINVYGIVTVGCASMWQSAIFSVLILVGIIYWTVRVVLLNGSSILTEYYAVLGLAFLEFVLAACFSYLLCTEGPDRGRRTKSSKVASKKSSRKRRHSNK